MATVVEATEGFEVVGEAASGEDSLSACARLRPDLVLMDVNLPGISGVEATRRLRALPSPPVVLLLSTYDADTADGFVSESGAAAYVTKADFGPDRLARGGSGSPRWGPPLSRNGFDGLVDLLDRHPHVERKPSIARVA